MPHQCTNCGQTFADGSKEMLSGCPDCGGNKFQFRPAGASDSPPPEAGGDTDGDAESTRPDPGESAARRTEPPQPDTDSSDHARSGGSVGSTGSSQPSSDTEDGAQASARTDVVSPDELAAAAEPTGPASEPSEDPPDDGTAQSDEESADPNLDALRQKLNDQFESIRIVSPGKYELNLMELYDREEYIISLREDGRYVIEMPEGWDDR
ncbi:OapC/ArvC family zinc-ribbon domain-containing protein [Halobaculum gomorrense]|uniref:Zn-ribbon containing protein n=1 Tax=Halobaculum gomorrense TaxID=43928 RepID=A0A1M5SVR2_9EURY|nr:Zn-ribbon containing protein [Halobaculum gomorrense]SHH42565.1 hypothetical protein SAMN05443636_2542 [Halobaculum gomorrense]